MSSAAAVAAASGAAAAAANASAEAHRAECRVVLATYEPKAATVAEMREYAGCVYTIHGDGEPLSASATLLIKLAILLAFVGAGFGAIWTYRSDRDVVMALVMSLLMAILFPMALGGLVLAIGAIGFVFS